MVESALAVYAAIDRGHGPPRHLDGRSLDPRVHALVGLADRIDPGGSPSVDRRRRELRRVTRLAFGPRHRVSVWDRTFEGPGGPVGLRLYRPHALHGAAPGAVFLHGGGWVVGDLDTHDTACRQLAMDAGAVIVSVDYRLAPEHPAPAATDDAVASYRWVVANSIELGIDADRLGVAGDSAGGNLAAVVGQQLRGEPHAPICQLLVYPSVDVTMALAASSPARRGYVLDIDAMEWFRSQYIPPGADRSDPLLSPLHAKDLSGLAPAIVATAGFDPLRAEGQLYAEALADAGNEVVYRCFDDQIHGFFNMSVIPSSRAAAQELGRLLGTALRVTARRDG